MLPNNGFKYSNPFIYLPQPSNSTRNPTSPSSQLILTALSLSKHTSANCHVRFQQWPWYCDVLQSWWAYTWWHQLANYSVYFHSSHQNCWCAGCIMWQYGWKRETISHSIPHFCRRLMLTTLGCPILGGDSSFEANSWSLVKGSGRPWKSVSYYGPTYH